MRFPFHTLAALLLLVSAFGLYLAYEIWRWCSGNPAGLTRGQFRRRLVGGALLQLDLCLWLFFDPLMEGQPARVQLLYLLSSLLLLVLPMILAVREAAFVMRQYLRSRRELVKGAAQANRQAGDGRDSHGMG